MDGVVWRRHARADQRMTYVSSLIMTRRLPVISAITPGNKLSPGCQRASLSAAELLLQTTDRRTAGGEGKLSGLGGRDWVSATMLTVWLTVTRGQLVADSEHLFFTGT